MRTLQELSVIAKLTTAKAVNTAKLQVKKIVRLLIKPPKKSPLSWESIIGEGFSQKRIPMLLGALSLLRCRRSISG